MSLSKRLFLIATSSLALGASHSALADASTIRMAFIDPLSGPFAATGANGLAQYEFYADELNKAGGLLGKKVEIVGFDNKTSPKESLIQLKSVIGEGIQFVFQGNSSGVAHALTDAVEKHNERNPKQRVLFLNYSAVDPALTEEKCNFWHFRFDAHADMKMAALTDVIAVNKSIKKIYIIGQDYSFGKAVAAAAVKYLGEKRPDIQIVGNELHPIGKVKDFSPYIAKIKSAGTDAIITGNWGADMLGLIKAADDAGLTTPFYTYYAGGSGITAAIGKSGVGKVRLVTEGTINPPITKAWEDSVKRFKAKNPKGNIDQSRISTAFFMLTNAIKKAGTTDPLAVAKALEGLEYTTLWGDKMVMRADDHQLQMPLRIEVHSDKNVTFDFDNSGFGLVTETTIPSSATTQPTSCKMNRPA